MLNTEAGQILVEYSKHIARWAKMGDKPVEKETPVSRRAHENAWRLLSFLTVFAEHTKESDMYWTLLHIAERRNKPQREQARLLAIAKREDSGYMTEKARLERTLAEMLEEERGDPKALKKTSETTSVPAKRPVAAAKSAHKKVSNVSKDVKAKAAQKTAAGPAARASAKSSGKTLKTVVTKKTPLAQKTVATKKVGARKSNA